MPNKTRWIRNINGATQPFTMQSRFEAGSTQVIVRGQLLEYTGDTNSAWVPIDSDASFAANLAIANEEIKDGDREGYYEIIVPRPGDIFEFALDTASAAAVGAPVYYASSTTVSLSGSNTFGDVIGIDHYPDKQGHLTDDASGDAGTTIRVTANVGITIKQSCSYYAAIQQ